MFLHHDFMPKWFFVWNRDESKKKLSTIYRLAYKCIYLFLLLVIYFLLVMRPKSLRKLGALRFHVAEVNFMNATFSCSWHLPLDYFLMFSFSSFCRLCWEWPPWTCFISFSFSLLFQSKVHRQIGREKNQLYHIFEKLRFWIRGIRWYNQSTRKYKKYQIPNQLIHHQMYLQS